MIDISKYSELQLKELSEAIIKERTLRAKTFHYQIGDCFCDKDTSFSNNWRIVRIDNIDEYDVTYTKIDITINLDRYKSRNTCSKYLFASVFKTPIDPSIFDEFSKSSKIIMDEKQKFFNLMKKLRHD